jgi:D-sedoheptulose 7-phosphate isomerase
MEQFISQSESKKEFEMKNISKAENHLKLLVDRLPMLQSAQDSIWAAYILLENMYQNKGKLLIAGNGGSAADADHIVGELMKGFRYKRKISSHLAENLKKVDPEKGAKLAQDLQQSLPAIALTNQGALSTAYSNDVDGVEIYAQQVLGYGADGDVFLGISTSGNAENVLYGAIVAKALGLKVIGLTGMGGELKKFSDVCIQTPQTETYLIQELHLPIYHCLCMMLEERFYGE